MKQLTFENTKAALDAYDAADAAFDAWFDAALDAGKAPCQQEVCDALDRLEQAIKAVGAAFALDTADRNSPEHCAAIHPGPKTPGPGAELLYVRQAVKRWEARKALG